MTVATEPSAFVGQSPAVRKLLALADHVAASDYSVLIEGETGTGKELIGRRLHEQSRRGAHPFIPVNCAGIGESLFESQLFGHLRGSFTGADRDMKGIIRTAEGGTVFLDEVGEIPLDLQPKLLRVLQEQEVTPVGQPEPVPVDVRFLAATNSRLRQGVHDGRFRADLFHRLNVVRLVLPPLRDRPEDLPLLLEHFSQTCAQECSVPPIDFDPDVLARLKTYSWPGNVRELKCWVERVYATGLPPTVLAEMLLVEGDWQEDPEDEEAAEVISLEEAERRAIERALRHTHHRQKEAARLLKIHRTTLSRKMRDYRIS